MPASGRTEVGTDLETWRAGWSSLVTSSHRPTEHPAWTEAAHRLLRPNDRLRIVGVGSPENPSAIAPLSRPRTSAGPWWQVGANDIKEPGDLVYADPAAAGALVDELVDRRMPVMLRRVPADSGVVKALETLDPSRATVRVRTDPGSPYIDLEQAWAEPERKLSSSRRSALRRSRRKAEALGELTVEVRHPEPAQVPDVLAEAFAVEARSWKRDTSTALALDEHKGAFYRGYLTSAAADGQFVAAFLRLDGEAIAMQLSVESATHHWVLKIGHDETYAKCSPGVLLTAAAVADTATRGLERYEFMGWPSAWIDAWATGEHRLVVATLYPRGPLGWAAASPETARGVGRRAKAYRAARAERAQDQNGASEGTGVTTTSVVGAIGSVGALVKGVKGPAKRAGAPLLRRAANGYIAGPDVVDAAAVATRLADQGLRHTLGYWNAGTQTPREVADALLAGVAAVARTGGYLSMKMPAVDFDPTLLAEVASAAEAASVSLHTDAQDAAAADRTATALAAATVPGSLVGATLPGRWTRSREDADRAVERGVPRIRLVKGQFPQPGPAGTDPALGFAALAERLAGGSVPVAVATHDAALARHALTRLTAAGTPCELELFYGLPLGPARAVATELGVPVRLYIPWGHPSLPYQPSLSPQRLSWLTRDGLFGPPGRI